MHNSETVRKDKILVLDGVDKKAAEILNTAGFQVDVKDKLEAGELERLIPDYVAVIVRSATEIRADIINKATNLKVIGRAGSGTDNIDKDDAIAKGILVMNADGNTISAAEHTIAMMMALSRHVPAADASMKKGQWNKKKFTGVELHDKTMGIIGLGKVGRAVAERAMGLKMKVIAYDPPLPKEAAERMGVDLISDLDELLEKADFISLHTQKLPEILLTEEKLLKCKKGARIINCARGGLIDTKALYEGLEKGRIAGAAIDVFETEPLFGTEEANTHEQELVKLANVVATPHLGASTTDAQVKVAEMIATQIKNYLIDGIIEGAVGFPSLSLDERKTLGPHLMLASHLGNLIGQITPEGRLQDIEIEYAGEAAKLKIAPLTVATLEWLLKSQKVQTNSINARAVAKDRSIGVKETVLSDEESYHTLMRIRVKTDKGTTQVAGTLINGEPRVVSIDNIELEAKIAAHMLFTRSNNIPGMVAIIGNVLGSSGINMDNFHMGKTKDGRENVSFIAVDREITQPVLVQLRDARKDGIEEVRVLNMSGSMPVLNDLRL